MNSARPRGALWGETSAYAVATCALGGAYLAGGLAGASSHPAAGPVGETAWFGIDRWAAIGPPWPVVFVALAVAVGVLVGRAPGGCRRVANSIGTLAEVPAIRLALGGAAIAVCWALSSGFLNPDGAMMEPLFRANVPRFGANVTHDEMLELYVHSRVWDLAQPTFGWDVPTTYRLLSCLAGGAVVYLALGFACRFPPSRRLLLLGGVFAGAWVQLFFGDVENYTLTNVWIFAYFVAAWRFLEGSAPFWPASALLAVATTFHAESLIFCPSLAVLAWLALRRDRDRDLLAGSVSFVAIVALPLWWFESYGLPFGRIFTHSNLFARGGKWGEYFAQLDVSYFALQCQLMVLLVPCVLHLPLLAGFRRIPANPKSAFFAAAIGASLLFVFAWRAQLGTYNDWNLFAVVAQPIGLLVWTTHAGAALTPARAGWLAAFVVLAATHAGSWIVANHRMLPG